MASVVPNIDYSRFSKNGELFIAAGVVVILFVMLVPLPTFFLDIMLSVSISLSMLVLITTMFMMSPLEFTIFPSLLLVTTLLRLALNVASTRLILLNGDMGTDAAGSIIKSFGEFVVGGSYVVGAVIFLIMFTLNKVVITAGTSRIAEVAARFTLDAMPGKQMAIEADLNAGLIDEEEATARRNALRKEADFYGAMDGACKFVSGDVNAGMFITMINLIGGIIIGVVQKDMDWQTALQTYSLLTIGDGLVSTIPSIIISTGTGLLVSRAAAEAKMGEEFMAQLTFNSKALKLVSGILVLFAIIPGLPTIPFLVLALAVYIGSRVSPDETEAQGKEAKGGAKGAKGTASKGAPSDTPDTPEDVQALLPLDTLELEVGYGLIPLVDEEQSGNLLARIRSIRRQFVLDMGVIIPSLHLRDNLQLKPGQYALLIKGNQVASAEILVDHFLAMNPGNITTKINGVETREPAFNLPAIWIPAAQREEAMMAGYTVVDPATVIATHLTEVFRRHLADFLDRQAVQSLLDTLAKSSPKTVEDLVPNTITLGGVQKVLQNLVRENVCIRDMLTICETLADFAGQIKSPEILTEYVREKLSRSIVRSYLDSQGVLPVLTLNGNAERKVQEGIRQAENGQTFLSLNPATAQRLVQNINAAVERAVNTDGQPVVLTTPMIRPHLAQLVTRFLPTIPIISQAEIPPDVRLQSVGSVALD
ncbi:MAG: flagellar biosynthesis protein FlhA [Desulfovibrionaceae bacterium]|nr:flagellar biosynthesis protein FlhA [Desulfovibrionaceae bacterium]